MEMKRSNTLGIFGILLSVALTLAASPNWVAAAEFGKAYGDVWYRNNVTLTSNMTGTMNVVNISSQITSHPQIGNYTEYKTVFQFNHSTSGKHMNLTHINFTLPDKHIALSKPIALYNSTTDFSAKNNLVNLTLLNGNNSEDYQIYSACLWNISRPDDSVFSNMSTYYIEPGYNNWSITYWIQPITAIGKGNESGPGYIEETWHVINPANNLTITEANITLTPYQTQWDIKTGISSVKVNGTTYTRNATSDNSFSILLNMSSVYEVIVKYNIPYGQSGTPSHGGGVEPITTLLPPLTAQQQAVLLLVAVVAVILVASAVTVVVLYTKGYFR